MKELDHARELRAKWAPRSPALVPSGRNNGQTLDIIILTSSYPQKLHRSLSLKCCNGISTMLRNMSNHCFAVTSAESTVISCCSRSLCYR